MGLIERFVTFASGSGAEGSSPAFAQSPREHELLRELATRAEAPDTGGAPVRYALHFTGTVQGVGFRWTNQGLARERRLTGWVHNESDGSVAMELQGPPAALAAHFGRLHASYQRFGARIWLESARALTPLEDEGEFEVRF